MCRRASLDLPPYPSSAGQARRFLSATCTSWELPELRDDLLLAVSEMVTNAVLHARTPLSVHAAVTARVVEVAVRDTDPSPPTIRAERIDLVGDLDALPTTDDGEPRHPRMSVGAAGSVTAGRGLHLLAAVTDTWGVTPSADGAGKRVWFQVATPAGWPYADDCTCPGTVSGLTAGDSGVRHLPGPWDSRPAARRP